MIIRYFSNLFTRWKKEEEGLAAIEASMIFPVMLLMLLGVFDFGNAILANQKTIRASQVVADLIARNNIVTDADIAEAIEAGRLAFEPLDSSAFGIDIVSFRFDEDADTEIVWRETENMLALPDAFARVDDLRDADEGVVMVAVQYQYDPLFTGFVAQTMEMQEIAFSRGRSGPVVNRQ